LSHHRYSCARNSVAEENNNDPGDDNKHNDDDVLLTASFHPPCLMSNGMTWSTTGIPMGVVAPEGYTWFGKFIFVCFEPARGKIYLSATLALGETRVNLEDHKAGGRAALRKNANQRDNADRVAGGDERGMARSMKISAGIISQNKERLKKQDHNIKIVSLLKQIDTARNLMKFKERMMFGMEMDMDQKRVV
jgi:hypothetical protein